VQEKKEGKGASPSATKIDGITRDVDARKRKEPRFVCEKYCLPVMGGTQEGKRKSSCSVPDFLPAPMYEQSEKKFVMPSLSRRSCLTPGESFRGPSNEGTEIETTTDERM